MAYGKGKSKELMKRMADLGTLPSSPVFHDLRSRMLAAIEDMASVVWPADILSPIPSGKEIDAPLVKRQSELAKQGLNAVWAEKARMIAKAAVLEQWKRGQRNLFGRFKNIASIGDTPMEDGTRRLVNLPKEFSTTLSDDDVASLQALADSLDFQATMGLFRSLSDGDAGIPTHHAEALRALANAARERFGRPVWKDDAVVQLHIDYRCIRGGRTVLEAAKDTFATAVKAGRPSCHDLPLTSVSPRGNGIAVLLSLSRRVSERLGDTTDLEVTSFVLELGPAKVQAKMVVTRPPAMASAALINTVVAEDFGFRNTSSIAVLRGSAPIGQAALERVSGHNGGDVSKLSKSSAKKFLADHVSGDETELLELIQFDGKDFLNRIKEHAKKVDGLRSEIDRLYNRLGRIRAEINRVAGLHSGDLVPEVPALPDHLRYVTMHDRFFRLLAAIGKLKAKRRQVYRAVAGLKTSWFGYVAQRKADLAEKYGAAVVAEDLDIVAVPTDDPSYKGRTFNKMINNGSKGQYNLRSENTLKWRSIPSVKIPSYYTSSTDWRTGTVDKAQRRDETFKAADGRRWDADFHAAEMIGRYLFLRPKTDIVQAALAA